MVDNNTQWMLPGQRPATYDNYVTRRNNIIKLLAEGKSVILIADELGRKKSSVYSDISKMETETGQKTIWGVVVEAMKLGWIPCPVERPHVHKQEVECERPPCAG